MNRLSQLNKCRIIEALNIREFYSARLGADIPRSNRNGWVSIKCLCPFHSDSRPGSVTINLNSGYFRCWACNALLSLVDFEMQTRGLSFLEALNNLAYLGGQLK